MRRLDRWLGIPLCFLASCALRVTRCFSFAGAATQQSVGRRFHRVLFLELSEMGSTVIAQPAMLRVREELRAEVFFVIFARNAESLRLLRLIPEENIFLIRDENLLVLSFDSLRFLRWTRRRGIDAMLDLELFSRFSALLTGLSGVPVRVGFHRFRAEGLYRGSMLTHPVVYNGHTHMAKNFLAMTHALTAQQPEHPYAKVSIPESAIRIVPAALGDEELDAAYELVQRIFSSFDPLLHRIVLLNPNSSVMLPQRRWPQQHYTELAQRIVTRWQDVFVAITGSTAEREESLAMEMQIAHPRVRSLAGMHSLRTLLALYSISHALVTNDSGPAHFSALTQIQSIVLFGPETSALYGSLGNTESLTLGLACSPCVTAANQKNSACTDAVCMRQLLPEHVLAAVARALHADACNLKDVSLSSANGAMPLITVIR